MLEYLKEEANMTLTENGAVTHRTSGSECLDLFGTIGALRHADNREITDRFARAWAEDRDLAIKILFYCRDIRGGLGERRVFRVVFRWLAENAPETVLRNLPFFAEYGRWDDVLVLLDTDCSDAAVALLKEQLEADLAADSRDEPVSLLGKWLPSPNASSWKTVRLARMLEKAFGLSERDYRKALTRLRSRIRILENNLRLRDYTFDYSKQPSRAMLKYREAFYRNDRVRYHAFLAAVDNGEAKLHADNVFPYEIVENARWTNEDNKDERLSLNVTWSSLPDFTRGENALVVADGSGSMYAYGDPSPASVAQSLAIYFAERNRGAFQGHFMTFSHSPRLVEIQGQDITEKVHFCERYNECANTDIQKVFDLILNTAIRNEVPQEELPSTLYIISDMEFDECAEGSSLTNFEYAEKKYREAGYQLPRVVFWNVDSRNRQQPVTMNTQGVILVSGFSPRIFSMVADGETDPYAFMLKTLYTERYAAIAA